MPANDPVSLERRISALEARISPEGEAVVPTYITVDPATGVVSAQFSGSVLLTEATSSALSPTNAIAWQDASSIIRSFAQAQAVPPIHAAEWGSKPDALDFAFLITSATEGGAAGSAIVQTATRDSIGVNHNITISDSNGGSAFLMGGVQKPPTVSHPVNNFGLGRIPDTIHPTLVMMEFLLGTLGGGSSDNVSVQVAGGTVGTVYCRAFGATPGLADIAAVVTFLVPANQQYVAVINTVSGQPGYPAIVLTTELSL